MLGRKDYTRHELESARKAIDAQVAAYKALAKAVAATTDKKAIAALQALEPLLHDNMVLALDRFFVHRIRSATGKDINPLNEVELLTESLLKGDAVLTTNNVIKYVPGDAVLGLEPGDRIALTAADFERLAKAFFADLESRMVS